jgi:hypothetical protein
MVKKTKKDRLRSANIRSQAIRRVTRFGLIGLGVIGAVGVIAYFAWQTPEVQSFVKAVLRGDRAGTYEFSDDYRQVGVGESFDFAGGKITIDRVRVAKSVQSMFGGGVGNEPPATYKPDRGVWLLVELTFSGTSPDKEASVYPGSVRLVDEDAEVYANKSLGSPAEDLYYETSSTAFGNLKPSNRAVQKSILIFDVPENARGLLLVFLREEEGKMKAVRGAKLSLTNQ